MARLASLTLTPASPACTLVHPGIVRAFARMLATLLLGYTTPAGRRRRRHGTACTAAPLPMP